MASRKPSSDSPVARKVALFFKSETLVLTVLRWIVIAVAPAALMLVMLSGTQFKGLVASNRAAEHAQLARNLSREGQFSTNVLRPVSLMYKADYEGHPDLYNAPAQPWFASWFFSLLGDRQWRAIGAAGAALWILSVWLTYLVARKWLTPGPASLATALYALNVAAINAALGGLAAPLGAIAVLLAVGFGARGTQAEEKKRDTAWWRVLLAGIACALAVLTDYKLIAFALVFAVYLIASQRGKAMTTGALIAGFIIGFAPWALRNMQVVGSPVFTLSVYELMANTKQYPGESVWRQLAVPENPFLFALAHPLEIWRKFYLGLGQFRRDALAVLDLLACVLFLLAFFGSRTDSRRWRGLFQFAVWGIAAVVAISSVTAPDPTLLLVWAPVVCIVAAALLTDWVRRRAETTIVSSTPANRSDRSGDAEEVSDSAVNGDADDDASDEKRATVRKKFRFNLSWLRLNSRMGRMLLYAAVLLFSALPLINQIKSPPPPSAVKIITELAAPLERLDDDAVVLTDNPALIAWYGDRRALMLPREEKELDIIEQVIGPIDAMYMTTNIRDTIEREKTQWWGWINSPVGTYRGFAPSPRAPRYAVLRLPPREQKEQPDKNQ
jgi:hypothetical protein